MNRFTAPLIAFAAALASSMALAQGAHTQNVQGGNDYQAMSGFLEQEAFAGNVSDLSQILLASPEGMICAEAFTYTKGPDVDGSDKSGSGRVAKVQAEGGGEKRGQMPDGYFKGIIETFATSVCRAGPQGGGNPYSSAVPPAPPVANPKYAMAGPDRTSTTDAKDGHDALLTYKDHPGLLKLDPTKADDQHIINTYSLMMTLGMIESSGETSTGVDTAKGCGGDNCSAQAAEAGLFQVSKTSVPFLEKQALEALLAEYRADKTKCNSAAFGGKTDKPVGQPEIDGAVFEDDNAFQAAMKTCPALSTEYTAMLLRVTDAHNGPLLRSEVQPKLECTKVLAKAYAAAKQNQAICSSAQGPKSAI